MVSSTKRKGKGVSRKATSKRVGSRTAGTKRKAVSTKKAPSRSKVNVKKDRNTKSGNKNSVKVTRVSKSNNGKSNTIRNKELSKREIKKLLTEDMNQMSDFTVAHLEIIRNIVKDYPKSDRWLKSRTERIIKSIEKVEKLYDEMMNKL